MKQPFLKGIEHANRFDLTIRDTAHHRQPSSPRADLSAAEGHSEEGEPPQKHQPSRRPPKKQPLRKQSPKEQNPVQ